MAAKTKPELEEELAAAQARIESLEAGAPEAPEAIDPDLSIAQRLALIAAQVGVLAPQAAPGGGIKFKYRGVDSTVAHVTPWLNAYQVVVIPRVTSHIITERLLNDGRVVKTAQVEVEYTFYGPKGDSIVAATPGLADDFADRATAQAMSVAYRTALLQSFHIAAMGEDPEESGEKVVQAREKVGNAKIANAQAKAAAPAKPAGPTPAEQMRGAILAVATSKGMDGAALNALGEDVTGKQTEQWWDDPDELNKILARINGG